MMVSTLDPSLTYAMKWFFMGSLVATFVSCVLAWIFRKRLFFQLQQSQESLQFTLQSGKMGTWDINLESLDISCSNEMLDLWGIRPHEFQGRRLLLQSKVHPDDLERMKLAINKAIAEDSIYECEYRISPSPQQIKWVLSRGRCTYAPGSRKPVRFSGVVYDITESKIKEEALASAIKAKDQFFMMASHELKTPLTCLELQVQVGQFELKNKGSEDFSLDRIESGFLKQREHLLRITRLVDNILDESQISEGRLLMQLEYFDLSEMVGEVIERFHVTAELSGVEVKYYPTNRIQGNWDRFRLEQVLINLLMNGIRYGNKKPIHVEVRQENSHAMMVVRDEGRGIKPEDQARIFDRFERAISEHEVTGMGLGLYISNNIVKAHGGEIRLKSGIGTGSEFTVVIPLLKP